MTSSGSRVVAVAGEWQPRQEVGSRRERGASRLHGARGVDESGREEREGATRWGYLGGWWWGDREREKEGERERGGDRDLRVSLSAASAGSNVSSSSGSACERKLPLVDDL